MHKLLQLQLKQCFGKECETIAESPQFQHFLSLIDESYRDYDDDNTILHRSLDMNSKELTEAIKEIKIAHEVLNNVTESIQDLIFYKDLAFKYIGCNQSCADFFGKSVSDYIGKDDFELYPLEHALGFRERDIYMFQKMESSTNQEWVKNFRGEDVLLLTTKHPLFNSKGELFGLVGIARDITKEYRLEQEIKEQQAIVIQQARLAAMGEMIGNIAHQWRQPINALGLILQDIDQAYRFGELDQPYIDTISAKAMEQIHYMSNTIDDFRNFFNPNKDKKVFSLNKSIENTKNILKQGISNSSIECSITIPEDFFIYGYKNEFSQVIFNLISNAKDALLSNPPKTPWIKVNVTSKNQTAEITVSDNGGGISPDILPSIFDPYFTTKEEGKGTGIGLYMAKKIIEEHMEGTLLVNNTKEGACFTIVLPIEKENQSLK
jgi:PAS domain S-box-containing protein